MVKRLPLFSLIADRCTSLRQVSQVHAQMLVTGRILDNFAASRLLVSYSLLHLPLALSLLSQTQSPNSFMFNTLIRSLSFSPSPSRSFLLFLHMLRSSVTPGPHTFPFLFKASSNLRSLPLTQSTHSLAVKHGLHHDPYVTNALVLSYSSCGVLPHARQVFDESPHLNPMIWTSMVSSYARSSVPRNAISLFECMLESGEEPCDVTLASVLSACARSGGLDMGRRVHNLIVEKNVPVGVILGTALVDMYAKNGAIAAARQAFVAMPERNVATWNALICGSAHHGHSESALVLFHEMERTQEARPNDVTFTGVLKSCCHGGLVELGREVFHSMEGKYGVEPKVEHYGCMVDLLGRSGRLEEAEELVRGMELKADVVVWGALLTACKEHGRIDIAERVVEEMLKLDPENHGVYVVLSNMYAEVARWDDVEGLRRVMRDVGLKKIPGWSSVDDHR